LCGPGSSINVMAITFPVAGVPNSIKVEWLGPMTR
jgi:hypothetical protein